LRTETSSLVSLLTAENIMLKDVQDLTSIKLIDFGISTKYDDTDLN
jgi:hypothetical protein